VATRITLIKKFSYRGDPNEEFSNGYAFTGTDPANDTEWLALLNALKDQEKTIYRSGVVIVRAYGYTDDSNTASAVWSRDLVAASETTPGTLTGTGFHVYPGDVAFWCRWKTSRLANGKPVYLRKYFHGANGPDAGTNQNDLLWPTQRTAAQAFATKLWDGSFIDGRTIRARGQASETIVGSNASEFVTTRTLKRRGRRPTAP
jgi:hypothetical protein